MGAATAASARRSAQFLTCLAFTALLGTAWTGPTAADTWTSKTSMPTARFCHASSVVDGIIYVIGGAANWLMVDAIQGSLMTGLSKGGRGAVGLSSQAIITDGNWHRAAFTWHGASRRLYVDGVLVAEDAHDSLAPSFGNLIIGTDKDMSPGTFWTGLIDDVRIYNRAISP